MATPIGIKTILYISLLLQGISMMLAWVFIGISVTTYEGKDWQKDWKLTTFSFLLGLLMTCVSLIAFQVDRERRDEKPHISVFVLTVVLLCMNYLCQFGIADEKIIKWNVTEIMVAIFDCVNIIASIVSIAIVLMKQTWTLESQQIHSN